MLAGPASGKFNLRTPKSLHAKLAAQAEAEGVRDLRRSGLLKVMQGLTSIEEVLAVTNE